MYRLTLSGLFAVLLTTTTFAVPSPQSTPPNNETANAPDATPDDAQAQSTTTPTDPNISPADVVLDDAGKVQSGDIALPVEVIERDPSNWFNIRPEDEWLNVIRDPLRKLDEDTGLSISGAYTLLFQQSIGPESQSAAAGDFDLFMRYTAVGRGTVDTGSIFMATEYRHRLQPIPPADLGADMGTLLGTTDGFSDRGWAIKELYWVQKLGNDTFRYGIGRVDTENLVGGHNLQSANTSFLNKHFSVNPTMAFPGYGFGVAAAVKATDWLYVSGGLTNADGNSTTIEIDTLFDEWRFFKFVEVGVTPTIDNLGEGRYRIAFWHLDSRSHANAPSDGGFTLIGDQKIGEHISLFARYGYSDADLTGVKQAAQIGGAYEGLFGSDSDLTGLAFGWADPEAGGLRDEFVLEVFHRMQLTGRIQFTLGAQLILDPSNRPEEDALGVFSARFRVSF